MKAFWLSLLGFILFMCSCKSKESARLINEVSKVRMEAYYTGRQSLVDTTFIHKIMKDNSTIKIVESLKIVEYDEESGKPIKETEAKRETTQNIDQVVTEEENRGLSGESNDSLNLSIDSNKKVESEEISEVGSEIKAFWERFGKVLGIGISCMIGLLLLYLWLREKRCS